MTLDEQDLQVLISQGNDKRIIQLIYALLDLPQDQVMRRVELLLQLGERYLTLALSLESGKSEQDIEEALKHLLLVVSPQTVCNPEAQDWYHEAIQYIEEALKQERETFDRSRAIRLACLAHTLHTE